MPAERNKNLKYRRMPNKEIEDKVKLFVERFKGFLTLKGFPQKIMYHISYYALIDIIIRVDKRKAYYMCFHDM